MGCPNIRFVSHSVSRTPRQDLFRTLEKYDRFSPVLYNLHWLAVFYRIFYILTITFKTIQGMSPSYISDLVSIRFIKIASLNFFWNILKGVCYQL